MMTAVGAGGLITLYGHCDLTECNFQTARVAVLITAYIVNAVILTPFKRLKF